MALTSEALIHKMLDLFGARKTSVLTGIVEAGTSPEAKVDDATTTTTEESLVAAPCAQIQRIGMTAPGYTAGPTLQTHRDAARHRSRHRRLPLLPRRQPRVRPRQARQVGVLHRRSMDARLPPAHPRRVKQPRGLPRAAASSDISTPVDGLRPRSLPPQPPSGSPRLVWPPGPGPGVARLNASDPSSVSKSTLRIHLVGKLLPGGSATTTTTMGFSFGKSAPGDSAAMSLPTSEDELFHLTTMEGKLTVEHEKVRIVTQGLSLTLATPPTEDERAQHASTGRGGRRGCAGRVRVRLPCWHSVGRVPRRARGRVPRLLRRRHARGLRGCHPRRRARHLRLRQQRHQGRAWPHLLWPPSPSPGVARPSAQIAADHKHTAEEFLFYFDLKFPSTEYERLAHSLKASTVQPSSGDGIMGTRPVLSWPSMAAPQPIQPRSWPFHPVRMVWADLQQQQNVQVPAPEDQLLERYTVSEQSVDALCTLSLVAMMGVEFPEILLLQDLLQSHSVKSLAESGSSPSFDPHDSVQVMLDSAIFLPIPWPNFVMTAVLVGGFKCSIYHWPLDGIQLKQVHTDLIDSNMRWWCTHLLDGGMLLLGATFVELLHSPESDIQWASRWDSYLLVTVDHSHWFSIWNSLIIILFLSGMVVMLMCCDLYQDISTYNQVETQEETHEEIRWKLIHGEVFRPSATSDQLWFMLARVSSPLACYLSLWYSWVFLLNKLGCSSFTAWHGFSSGYCYLIEKPLSAINNNFLARPTVPAATTTKAPKPSFVKIHYELMKIEQSEALKLFKVAIVCELSCKFAHPHCIQVMRSIGLGASRILRGGECHGLGRQCGPPVAGWAGLATGPSAD